MHVNTACYLSTVVSDLFFGFCFSYECEICIEFSFRRRNGFINNLLQIVDQIKEFSRIVWKICRRRMPIFYFAGLSRFCLYFANLNRLQVESGLFRVHLHRAETNAKTIFSLIFATTLYKQ